MKILILAFLVLSFSSATFALKISDADFPESLQASEKHPQLTLNGAALRELYLLVETYAGALYLEAPSQDPATIISSNRHKKMVFHVLMNKVSARRLSNALQEALVLNVSAQTHSQLEPSIETMLSYFKGNLHQGDQVEFIYNPNKSTEVMIGGVSKGTIPGKEFYDSMLKVWIGEHPVTRSFKQQVLGATSLN